MTSEEMEEYFVKDWNGNIVWLKEGFTAIPLADMSVFIFKRNRGLSYDEALAFARVHYNGNEEEKTWIEDVLEDINYHIECGMIYRGQYKGFENRLKRDAEEEQFHWFI